MIEQERNNPASASEPTRIARILAQHEGKRGWLISTLKEIQRSYGYLPEETLREVSERTHYSLVDIYGVATFYQSFSLEPRGRHRCSVCQGTACHVRGAPAVISEFERQLNIDSGKTTADREYSLETVNCLGACAVGPIVVVDGHYFSKVEQDGVERILQKTKEGLDTVEVARDERVFPVEVSCSHCNHDLMDAETLIDGYPAIRVTISFNRKHCSLRLSGLWGSFSHTSTEEVPPGTVVNFFCPHCHADLVGVTPCTDCDAPLVPMIVKAGGMAHVCSRRGCKNHMLDVNGVNF